MFAVCLKLALYRDVTRLLGSETNALSFHLMGYAFSGLLLDDHQSIDAISGGHFGR